MQQLALLRYINPYAAAGLPFGYGGLPGGMAPFGAMNGVAGDPGAIQVIDAVTITKKKQYFFLTERGKITEK